MSKKTTIPDGLGFFSFIGTTIRCNADDESIYCNFMKIINLLLMTLIFIYVLYVTYNKILVPLFSSKKLK